MAENPNYKLATNKAYETLGQLQCLSLPIKVSTLIRGYGNIRLFSYTEMNAKYNFKIDDLLLESEYGFTLKNKENYIIAYNSNIDLGIVRFTLAHELGHYILKHTIDDNKSDKEANCFARNLLSPIPIAKKLNLINTSDYTEHFIISPQAATVAIKMSEVDYYHINYINCAVIEEKFVFNRVEPNWRQTLQSLIV